MSSPPPPPVDVTITIGITGGQIDVNPKEVFAHNGKEVTWKGDKSVGLWTVALMDGDSPFHQKRRAFSNSGTGEDGAKIVGDPKNGGRWCYVVFCRDPNNSQTFFLDPIIVIHQTALRIKQEVLNLADDLRDLAARADEIAAQLHTPNDPNGSAQTSPDTSAA
jgi:hypothetical protein